jgi:hypothetical protein
MDYALELSFPDPDHVLVTFQGATSGSVDFTNPLQASDYEENRWYLEVYATHSLGDPDDAQAKQVVARLPVWGKALFRSVLESRAAIPIYNRFRSAGQRAGLLTVTAADAAILRVPWELLHETSEHGTFLFASSPRASIRRRLLASQAGTTSVPA